MLTGQRGITPRGCEAHDGRAGSHARRQRPGRTGSHASSGARGIAGPRRSNCPRRWSSATGSDADDDRAHGRGRLRADADHGVSRLGDHGASHARGGIMIGAFGSARRGGALGGFWFGGRGSVRAHDACGGQRVDHRRDDAQAQGRQRQHAPQHCGVRRECPGSPCTEPDAHATISDDSDPAVDTLRRSFVESTKTRRSRVSPGYSPGCMFRRGERRSEIDSMPRP